MRSSSAAHVVVLPEPVGPVTTTRPRMASAQLITVGGRPSSSASGAAGTTLNTNEAEPRWEKADTRNRPEPLKNEKSDEPFCSYSRSLTSDGITRCFTARVSSGVSASRRGSGISRPATRTRGAEGTFRCRSEAPIRIVSASAESRSKAIVTVIVRLGPGLECFRRVVRGSRTAPGGPITPHTPPLAGRRPAPRAVRRPQPVPTLNEAHSQDPPPSGPDGRVLGDRAHAARNGGAQKRDRADGRRHHAGLRGRRAAGHTARGHGRIRSGSARGIHGDRGAGARAGAARGKLHPRPHARASDSGRDPRGPRARSGRRRHGAAPRVDSSRRRSRSTTAPSTSGPRTRSACAWSCRPRSAPRRNATTRAPPAAPFPGATRRCATSMAPPPAPTRAWWMHSPVPPPLRVCLIL